ncbi:biotin carboxylase N-terminal domain-containing protein [Salinibacterium sp. ZJ450]|uniref:acetyl/propionyl/methylcrotonyl-CoA carboxylase subunit alpha n=1 Tax=Salinibacterium sp. ZJ450 TaxID=2708338 RepID=UPI001422784C|nr:biotin carboxylase N-terminal domain-containing protein [Salinibacterium sp. ZJ450]
MSQPEVALSDTRRSDAALFDAALFNTVLVANRGEIACRVIRTLRRLGIRSVAVYSDADRHARHVFEADVAVRIGPAAATESYLDSAAIVEAARRSGAQAVHPGYGFLSESPTLAAACADAGIVFIGPGIDALTVMGDKIRAKRHVAERGVPVIPGTSEPSLDDAQLIAAAADIGFPLLVKPSAGGGGKGMQIAEHPGELPAALAAARRIATSAFGDDTLLLERLITRPRHIEVQVLADNHGAVIHLGERECSLQRRHQKVIEEAPSALLDDSTRARIGDAACTVARSVGYRGAGTIEFLASDDAPEEFFFMEMNTRLQVEHPVTEQVTGLDLVEWQVRIAAGEALTLAQADVRLTGHAIEARVYAERPDGGFLPSSGTVLAVREPAGEGIRVDSSLQAGLEISSHYDPLLAKVIATGVDRDQALARLDRALADTVVLGVHTNIEYLRALIADPAVRAARLDTTLIDRLLEHLVFRQPDAAILTAAALLLHAERWTAADTLWTRPSGWRLGEHRPSEYRFLAERTPATVRVARTVLVAGAPEATSVTIDGQTHAARLTLDAESTAGMLEFDGATRCLALARDGDDVWIGSDGAAFHLVRHSRGAQLAAELAAREREEHPVIPEVRSPMPGTVTAVTATSGDMVQVGQALVSVEAMKMEHKLLAPVAGHLRLSVAVGDLVKADQLVATITAPDSPAGES